jgi:hypothetical protein
MESLDQKNYNKEYYNLTSWLVAIFVVKIIIILVAYLSTILNNYIYETYIKIAEQSLVPYKDFYFEYPPLFAFIVAIPFNLIKFKNIAEYQIYFQIFILIFDLMAMQTSFKIFAKLNNNKLDPNKQKKFYLIWTINTLALSFFINQYLEYVVIFIFALNILYFNVGDDKYNFKFYLLSIIGIFTKIISSLNLPLAILFHSYKKSKNLSEFIFLISKKSLFLALLIGLILLTFEYFFDFQLIKSLYSQYFRAIEIFSIIGNYIFIINKIFGVKSEIYLEMSMSIKPNSFVNVFLATHLFKIIYSLFIFITFLILAINKKNNKEILIDLLLFMEGSATIILIFLSFHNVASPQYIGYLVPIISILAIHYSSKKLLFSSLIIFVLTPILYPFFPIDLIKEKFVMLIILTIRNLTILFTCFYFIFKFYQKLLKPLKNLTC